MVTECDLRREIEMVAGCDLMSDVLMFTRPNSLLLTGLTAPQVIHTAEITEIAAICFVRGKRPGEETIELAMEESIPLLTTNLAMYESCGKLYKTGLSSSVGVVDGYGSDQIE